MDRFSWCLARHISFNHPEPTSKLQVRVLCHTPFCHIITFPSWHTRSYTRARHIPLVDFRYFWIGVPPNHPKTTCKISNSCFNFVMSRGRHRQTDTFSCIYSIVGGRIFIEELILGIFALLGCYSSYSSFYGRFGTRHHPILKGLVQEYSSPLGQLDPSCFDAILWNVGYKRNYAEKQSRSTSRQKWEITQS